ncbi:MAG: hypothetical protein KGL39_06710 [Patescibacteria group bacterium]|nr:hypothetical protein [Patescibacteria group bacterium]
MNPSQFAGYDAAKALLTGDAVGQRDAMLGMLEALVDGPGLPYVVELLGMVARAKAEHVAEVWQDDQLARDWEQAGHVLGLVQEDPAIQVLA